MAGAKVSKGPVLTILIGTCQLVHLGQTAMRTAAVITNGAISRYMHELLIECSLPNFPTSAASIPQVLQIGLYYPVA